MHFDEIKKLLSGNLGSEVSNFGILKEIARRVNRYETHDQGRELVIRALAVLDRFAEDEKEILMSLVRSVGLFPYMTDHLAFADVQDHLAHELHRADHIGGNLVFHSLQARIVNQLIAGANVVLSAWTSVGKSLVIDSVIASGKFEKIVIVVPTIALIDETRRRLSARFGGTHAIITHHTQGPRERFPSIFVLTQERAILRDDLEGTKLVVIDEFYKMDLQSEKTPERSIDLNIIFHRLAKQGAQFYLLGPHIQSTSGLTQYEHHFIPSDFTTVAVDVVKFDLPRDGTERKEKLLELCATIDGPTIIYCQSPPSATDVALYLLESGILPEVGATEAAVNWIGSEYHPEWAVCAALRFGIGIHHGGVPRALQQYFIRMFNERVIRFLICTSTIIEGVNTVAKNVIVYDRRKNVSVLDNFTYKNIAGRAGRMREYFVGNVYVLESPPEESSYSVNCPIGNQSLDTPLSLLLGLDDDDLSPESLDRVQSALRTSTLSEQTLRLNRQVALESQEAIASAIRAAPLYYSFHLGWNGMPSGDQLREVCELIFDHLESRILPKYGIVSGAQLAWHLNQLRMNQEGGIRSYIQSQITHRSQGESISEAVEKAMKILRNVICQRFPQALRVIENIQAEVLSEFGLDFGNYGVFADQSECCFIPSLLYALDEYGLPTQTAARLEPELLPATDLNTVLRRLKRLPASVANLDAFERDVLRDVQDSIDIPRSAKLSG